MPDDSPCRCKTCNTPLDEDKLWLICRECLDDYAALRRQRDDLLAALKECMEIAFQVGGGPLDQAAVYGPDFEPPSADHCHRRFAVFRNLIAACEGNAESAQ